VPAVNLGGPPAPAINPGGAQPPQPPQPPQAGTPGTPGTPPNAPAVRGTPLEHPETVPIVWERVVVRDAPRTGVIIGRVGRGEQVTLLARASGWFEVRTPTGTGWIFGAAVGR
ncbi:MAG: SH3 domain-containing protein, partial [Deltaproteobacteria bacterium]